jgi:hypothetical protein
MGIRVCLTHIHTEREGIRVCLTHIHTEKEREVSSGVIDEREREMSSSVIFWIICQVVLLMYTVTDIVF